MSINDTPFVREAFAAFDIQEVETTWTIAAKTTGAGAKVTELIIRSKARWDFVLSSTYSGVSAGVSLT
jgi:hypothetical protein